MEKLRKRDHRSCLPTVFAAPAIAILLLWSGCALHPPAVDDLEFLSQTVSDYIDRDADRILAEDDFLASSATYYLERHFAPWDGYSDDSNISYLEQSIERARTIPGYAENKLPHDPRLIEGLIAKMDMAGFPSLSIAAITLRETNVRGFPTDRPRFLAFSRPGEGYPFDYWQYSLLFANTPVHIIHSTRTGDWLYVQAPFVSGWVRSHDLGIISREDQNRFRRGPFLVPLRDRMPLHDENNRFIFTSRLGGLYPQEDQGDGEYHILAAEPGDDGKALLKKATLSDDAFAPFPLEPTGRSIAAMSDAMADDPYGWGGLYGNRDCSAFLRDLFAGFGLWLPRNSYWQAHDGQGPVMLTHLSPAEKERFIIEKAVPFATVLWMPGHVMLYIGEKDGRAMAVHVMWGLRSYVPFRGEGRIIVGGMAVTTLTPGIELVEVPPDSLLINRIEAMRVLVPAGGDE